MLRVCLPLLGIALLAPPAPAADTLPPADARFKAAAGDEVPSFQRHVVPLMGRLGCNGRACHGSFQGQGGFRLSLFGYDFKSDHDALAGEKAGRIDRKDVPASLILAKPTLAEPHKGGKRMAADGWEYNVIRRWVAAGAPARPDTAAAFSVLEVEPKEIVAPKGPVQLKVTAKWADGTAEEVTPLCRFRTNDESVATVSEAGAVTAVGKGDTAVVAFYDNGIATVPVLLPVSDKVGDKYPAVPTPTKVDELVVAKLRKLGVVPADLCTDAEFLRRVSLDLTGTLPDPHEVRAFLADTSADKRAKKVDELLASPGYAAWWTTRLCDFSGNSERNGPLGGEQALNREKARQWYEWVHRRVKENAPYDKIVEGVLLAVGRMAGQTYPEYCEEMSGYFRAKDPLDFPARDTMPFFWTRKGLGKPEEGAMAVAHAFLGVQLQCAQCHKHPYDQWTKQDFDQFAVFFSGVRYGGGDRKYADELKKGTTLAGMDEDNGSYKRAFVSLLAGGKVLPFKDLTVPQNTAAKKGAKPGVRVAGRVITPKLLGGEEVIDNAFPDPRGPVMEWMRDTDNPYFARAFVNRVWAGYFGVGIIEPADDLNLANPPSNPELLAHLADGFVAHKFDMKWLHRTIATSRTYQLGWKPNDTNRYDDRNFSRSVLRRLPAEVTYDAVVMATASDDERKRLRANPAAERAIGASSGYAGAARKGDDSAYAVTLFGKPPRTINCDCERSNEPALLQTVFLRNDPEVLKLLDRPGGWLKQVAKGKSADPDELVREAYLRVLSRLPDDREAAAARKSVSAGASGLRDLLWALVNTKEFVVNR